MSACEFCDEFSDGRNNTFILRYGPELLDRVILATERFCVIPSLGQITQGHLLVVPTGHFCSLCDLPIEHIEELENLCLVVRSTLRKTFGACVFFEHGIRGEGGGGCGIDHAHMHAVPVEAGGVLDILSCEFSGSVVGSLAEVKGTLARTSSYLLFEDANSTRHVFPVESLPSQYMRKLVAESIGKREWDWRKCGYEPDMLSTMRLLLPIFSPVAAHRG